MSLFSILIPTRNRSEYLKYALDSALLQTFRDLEVVISDNASEDNTREVVEKINDTRIKYSRVEQFVSVAENFNNVFRKSSGEYFILMGDDDYLMPYYLEEIYKCLCKSYDVDVFLSNTAEFDYRTNRLLIYQGTNCSFREEDKGKIIKQYFNFIAVPHNSTMSCFSKKLAKEATFDGKLYGGPFPDYLANFSMIVKANRVFKTDLITNITTITKKSLCVKQFSTNIDERKDIFYQAPLLKSVTVPIEGEYIHINGFYQTLALLQARFPAETGSFKINKRLYYEAMGRELVALAFQDFKGFDFVYFKRLISFCLKIPFSVFLTFIIFHFPARLLYGITPEKIRGKAANLYLKIVGRNAISATVYLDNNSGNIIDVKERVAEYVRLLKDIER